jgi:hypothetical protein
MDGGHHRLSEADPPAHDRDDGGMQLVVQLAHEMICGSPSGRFTRCTTVGTAAGFVVRTGSLGRTGLHVLLQVLLGVKTPVHSSIRSTPRWPHDWFSITLGERRNPLAVDDQGALFRADRVLVTPIDGVVVEQVGQGRGIGDVVDRDHVEPSVSSRIFSAARPILPNR